MKTITNIVDYTYKVPASFYKGRFTFSLHTTWSDAYKYAKRRKVPMYAIYLKKEDEHAQKRYFNRFRKSITPFINKLKKLRKR